MKAVKQIIIILLTSILLLKSFECQLDTEVKIFVKRASLWDRVRNKKITEDSPNQTYKYRKLDKVEFKQDEHGQNSSSSSSSSSSSQQTSSNFNQHESLHKPIPSWLQRDNISTHNSLPLPSNHQTKLSKGGQKIENKVNQLTGGVRQREQFREGFTLVRGAKAARNLLKQNEKLNKIESKSFSSLSNFVNVFPKQITQMQYNKNLNTLKDVESDVSLHMRQARMNNNVLKNIAESAHHINDIKAEIKSEKKAKKRP